MKRSNTMDGLGFGNLAALKQRVAYHEAGHATAIHINNRLKNLPPIFYKIIFEKLEGSVNNIKLSGQIGDHKCIARTIGGLLIQSLPLAFDVLDCQAPACTDKSAFQFTDDYRLAFEADIINLLVGPLAEAKFSYQIDGELFNHQLLTVQALKTYGGDADLAVVDEYLQSYSADQNEQNEILNRLFIQANNFVNDNANWKAITRLVNYIHASNKNIISCEEVAEVLDGK